MSQPMSPPHQADQGRPGIFGARRRLEQVEAEYAQLSERTQAAEAELARQRFEAGREIHRLHGQVAALHIVEAAVRARMAEAAAEAERIVASVRSHAADLVAQAEREARQKLDAPAGRGVRVPAPPGRRGGLQEPARAPQEATKALVRRDAAILSATSWTVNGSSTEGKKMVRDFSKLMLRAYNAEADNCVRTMKPHRLVSSIERLTKAATRSPSSAPPCTSASTPAITLCGCRSSA